MHTGDGAGLLSMLAEERWSQDSLQSRGDGVYAAVRMGAGGAFRAAAICVATLDERDWEGDRELAQALGGSS